MSQPASDPYPRKAAYCANCRSVLVAIDRFDGDNSFVGTIYEHGTSAPPDCPEAVPVLIPEGDRHPDQVSVCDFCGGPGVEWDYPAEDFPTPGDEELVMVGIWAACGPCHDDIEAGAWGSVIERWSAVNGMVVDESTRAHVTGIYSQFSLSRRGAARPV